MTQMTKKSRFRPSPAMVVGCVALFLTLAGTALALPKNTVRSPQIVNGAVKTVDLGRNAVRSGKILDEGIYAADLHANSVRADEIAADAVGAEEIAPDAVGSPEVAPESLTAADLGPDSVGSSEVDDQSLGKADLGPDSVGSGELGGTTVRTDVVAIAAGANRGVSVSCQPGEQVLSGGGQPGHFGVEMTTSRPSGNGWLYQARNDTPTNSTIRVYALCLSA